MQESIDKIIDVVKQTLEKTPPELASDIMERGIVLAGGGALIHNLDKLLAEKTEMPVYIAENPLECVARGAEKTLEDLEKLRAILTNSRRRRWETNQIEMQNQSKWKKEFINNKFI